MSKRTILCLIAVLSFGLLSAQEIKFGIKGGFNGSNWVGDTDGLSLKFKFGFNVGAFAEIKLSNQFGIQPEILYSTQGTKVQNGLSIINDSGDIIFNLSYINVPVMFKYYADSKFNIEVGPQIGFLSSAKGIIKPKASNQRFEQDAKKSFESVDFGLNFGLGYDFSEHLAVGFRYNIGLSNVLKTAAGDDSKVHNNVLALSLAYKF